MMSEKLEAIKAEENSDSEAAKEMLSKNRIDGEE